MRLIRARVTNYKSIDDSGWVDFNDVTCLVGKNESGKTAFLKALLRLSPIKGVSGDFDAVMDYPRKNYLKHKSQLEGDNSPVAVRAEFELSSEEIAVVESQFGAGVLTSPIVEYSKNYKNVRWCSLNHDEKVTVTHLLSKSDLSPEIVKDAGNAAATIPQLIEFFEGLEDRAPSVETFLEGLKTRFKKSLWHQITGDYFGRFLPRFFYFDDYSVMKGNVVLGELKQRRDDSELTDADRAFLALLDMVGADLDDFEDQDNYEKLKAELEAASIGISDEVFSFWSQNRQLEVEFDLSSTSTPTVKTVDRNGTTVTTEEGEQENTLRIRIKNQRHRVTVPFDERSRGFVWFFSFLAYFSQIEQEGGDNQLILLLDEPGLALHAKAQGDFLRFIDERLAPKHQVAYTTHSPFLIDATKLERVRTVQDKDNLGTVVENDVLRPDRDTLFPIQAAIGYEVSQTLFVGSHNLLVEGPSDLIYLQILSEAVGANGGVGLDERWVIVPVGGASKVSTFVSLLGANQGLTIGVLMDIAAKDRQVIDNLRANQLLLDTNLIQVNEFTGTDEADIEDLFDPQFYVDLVNATYSKDLGKKPIKIGDLVGDTQRILKRTELFFKRENVGGHGKFSHYRPASYLLKNQVGIIEKLDGATVARATALFKRVNALLAP
jgi:hypothetical protein